MFYKITFGFMFRPELSVIAAALMGCVTALIIAATSFMYANALLRLRIDYESPRSPRDRIVSTFLPWFLAGTAANCLFGWLVPFGFSARFAEDVLLMGRYDRFGDQLAWYFAVLAIPTALHYSLSVIEARRQM
jgi:hypothetical protein